MKSVISMAGPGIICVSNSKEAQLMKRVRTDDEYVHTHIYMLATFRMLGKSERFTLVLRYSKYNLFGS